MVDDEVLFDSSSVADKLIKEGSLDKMGVTNPSWKSRWFRLQHGVLYYYKSHKDRKPLGDIVLENCSVYASPSKRLYHCLS